jgi:hypothetical protein
MPEEIMTRRRYYAGLRFISETSSTPEEKENRRKDWIELALPLVEKFEASIMSGIK